MRTTCRSRSISTSICSAPNRSPHPTSASRCNGALGRTQLHLFERDLEPTSHHHFAITVDDLEPAYRAALRRDAFDRKAFGNHLVELPGDVVQMYVRDPAGNLVELDQAGVQRLADDLRAQLKHLWDFNPQSEENMRGRLFVP
jgi:hypothetical protein